MSLKKKSNKKAEVEESIPSHTSKKSFISSPIQYMAVAREGTYIYDFIPEDEKSNKIPVYTIGKAVIALYSNDGNLIAFVLDSEKETLEIKEADTFKTTKKYKANGQISKIEFSPLSNYILLFTRYDENTNKENVCIYQIESDRIIFKCTQKQITKNSWPCFKWTSNEQYCCRFVANGLHIYKTSRMELNEIFGKIVLEKLISFQPSPESENEKKSYVALFSGKLKDGPATIQIYDMNNLQQPKAKKCLFDADECTFKFNNDGSALLALTKSDVDKSGRSYYGSNKLFFFRSDGSIDGELVTTDDAPVHDVQWNPIASEFLVARGSLPPEVILYDGKTSKAKTSYGNLRRNTIRWCPFGSTFLLGGFGNLAGDVHVIHHTKNKVIGTAKIPCAVQCEFAPDGRHFLAATTTPRLRVDNCVKIYRYNGDLLHKVDYNELYFVSWRMKKVYKQRSPSVGREPALTTLGKTNNETNAATGGDKVDSVRSGILAALMRQERAVNEIPKILSLQNGQQQNQSVVGAPPEKLSKSANRNARRKKGKAGKLKNNEAEVEEEKNKKEEPHVEIFKKAPKEEDSIKEAIKVATLEKKASNKKKSDKPVEKDVEQKSQRVSVKDSSSETKSEVILETSIKKQIKTIKKKLNDIDKLKLKENLNVDQKLKLNSEEDLKKSLNELQEKIKKFDIKQKSK